MTEAEIAALEAGLADDDRAVLDELADTIARYGMVAPAMFFFESMQPLGVVGAAVMTFLRPIVGIVWRDPRRWDALARILDRRGSIELLVRRLEARA
ncbi:MAG: hypothetical protein R2939_07465 [Kofleriaceae bacterium]